MDVTNNSYYVDPFMYWCGDQPDQAAAMEAVDRAVPVVDRAGRRPRRGRRQRRDRPVATTRPTPPAPTTASRSRARINSGCLDIPAELPGVVTVSSFARIGDDPGHLAVDFSNRGLGVDRRRRAGLVDPVDDRQRTTATASRAVRRWPRPHVAGVLALLAGTHPDVGARRS